MGAFKSSATTVVASWQMREVLSIMVAAGINIFDTADSYGESRSSTQQLGVCGMRLYHGIKMQNVCRPPSSVTPKQYACNHHVDNDIR
jgi:predicted oxidoreductase